MGIVSDKSSDDQTIHPDYAKVAGKTCHITLKIPLKLDDKGKRRAGRNDCKWFLSKWIFLQLDSIVYSLMHTSTMINLGPKET